MAGDAARAQRVLGDTHCAAHGRNPGLGTYWGTLTHSRILGKE